MSVAYVINGILNYVYRRNGGDKNVLLSVFTFSLLMSSLINVR